MARKPTCLSVQKTPSKSAKLELSALMADYKKYASVIAAVAVGIGSIVAGSYSQGAQQILQTLALLTAGAAVVGLHRAVAKVSAGVIEASSKHE